MTTTVRPTRAELAKALELVQTKYGLKAGSAHGPTLVADWDWFHADGWPTIVWEGGPYEWAVECSFELLPHLPAGVWLEPATSWALGVYKDV